MGHSYNLEPPIPRQRDVEPNENKLGITALEKRIVSAVVAGYTSRECAEMMGVSQPSLRHYVASIMAKLRVVNRLELVLVALHNNLIDPLQ